ncbi:hypothetical protein OHT59_29735 [Streptomyces sp. NBC_00243]|uniref:hypothetical protein n=1 Tax=Streptomyces sp. NBC_00243 TaxID=2975688 RepID=UPI002DD8149B|nr:hypothetical protein [Streptomyces sp. NBC_00243]WRZ22366.1 hypothetical protein OHT59_29735 [Streptomyces sp. NBC_00243]
MRKRAIFATAAAGAALLGSLSLGAPTASATVIDEQISGTVYDDGWSHYSRRRCATLNVVLDVSSSPDDDQMYHYASRSQGGGGSYGTKRADEFTGGVYMNLNSGCFYWNSRQQEGTFETDWEDVWYGEITY